MTSITIAVINNKEHEEHSRRVCQYAAILAKEAVKLDASIQPDIIEQAVLYHDIGKVKIPNKILDKRGKITTEEFLLMKKHSKFGAAYIKEMEETECAKLSLWLVLDNVFERNASTVSLFLKYKTGNSFILVFRK